jgi:integrase
MKLTVRKVEALRKRPNRGRYGDGHGLVLQVVNPNNASWLFCYQRQGRPRSMGLGPLHTIGLKEARERAYAARRLLLDGIDPLEAKRAERDRRATEAARNVTFRECAELYYEAHVDSWTNAQHRQQFLNSLRDYAYPIIGSVAVAAVDEALMLKVLKPIWKDKTVTAKRVRNRIAAILDFAAAAKYRSGTNPARWEGNLEFLLPKPDKIATVKHLAALPYAEMNRFMTALRALPRMAGTVALEFTILTAARTGEVIGATWNEIDFETRTWTIPAQRMKARTEHRVPLTPAVVELLKSLPREEGNPFVFVGERGGHINAMTALRALRQLRDDITTHGFRSTFSTWASEMTSFPPHVIELSLAHAVGNAVLRAYRRTDLFEKRRKLMAAWAAHCEAPVAAGGVVPIRSGRR